MHFNTYCSFGSERSDADQLHQGRFQTNQSTHAHTCRSKSDGNNGVPFSTAHRRSAGHRNSDDVHHITYHLSGCVYELERVVSDVFKLKMLNICDDEEECFGKYKIVGDKLSFACDNKPAY